MKKLPTILLLFLWILSSYGQKEANIWYFGDEAGIDFNVDPPIALDNGVLSSIEGCASISNSNGNILFYTDGQEVYNRNHQLMSNGGGLFGDNSSTSSAIIVPFKGVPNKYYLFTTDGVAGPDGLRYSIVDMNLDNGLGAITNEKNILLHTPVSEKLTATRSIIDGNYWILSHKWDSNEFIAYKIDDNGLNLNPVISGAGVQVGPTITNSAIGVIKFSAYGDQVAMVNSYEPEVVQLFDFDSQTGLVSNPKTILNTTNGNEQENVHPYGVEFSPNGKFLYISVSFDGLYQFDISLNSETAISNSAFKVKDFSSLLGTLQLAPNNKIYLTRVKYSLDVINQPNEAGILANFESNVINLGNNTAKLGLPTFMQTFFLKDLIIKNTCLGDVTQFILENNFDSVIWNFDDPNSGNNTATGENPTHVFSAPGTYQVAYQGTIGNQVQNFTKDVLISETPIAYPVSNLAECPNQEGEALFDTSNIMSQIINNQQNVVVDFFDENGNLLNVPLSNPLPSTTQTITARISNVNNNECFNETTFNLIVYNFPNTNLKETYSICDRESVEIIIPDNFDSYNWSTGNSSNSIILNEPGAYTVALTKQFELGICEKVYSFELITSEIATIKNIETIDWSEENNSLIIYVEGSGDYIYSLDNINYQANNSFHSLPYKKEYKVYVKDKNGCGIAFEEVSLLYYPKFFTPNNDGFNDRWNIYNFNSQHVKRIAIYDRYGKIIYNITQPNRGWDGNYNGKRMPSNDYWFLVKLHNGKTYKGNFTMKR